MDLHHHHQHHHPPTTTQPSGSPSPSLLAMMELGNVSTDNSTEELLDGGGAPLLLLPPPHGEAAAALIVLVVALIISATIVGNVLVIVAVLTSRALRAPQNLFLVSLASADILVAALVIPFSLANEVMGYWYFGSTWCAFYLALDVLFCTSSIVHLCAISLDRYWSVTKAVSYNLKRTPRRIKSMIGVVWLISAVISFPPLLMTKHDERECLLNDETWYILSSCLVSFFAPGLIMILVYCKIYKVAKQRSSTVFVAKNGLERQPSQSETCFVRGKAGGPGEAGDCDSPGSSISSGGSHHNNNMAPAGQRRHHHQQHRRAANDEELDDIDLEESCSCPQSSASGLPPSDAAGGGSNKKLRSHRFKRRKVEGADCCPRRGGGGSGPPLPSSCRLSWASARASHLFADHHHHHRRPPPSSPQDRGRVHLPMTAANKSKVAQMREKRFTFVLAVVMGVFVVCWFPFFFTYSLHAVCRDSCTIPGALFNVFFWIGYCNSSVNPIIYTIFNRDFRKAFKKIICKTRSRRAT